MGAKVFLYTGKTSVGKTVKGTVEAETEVDARMKLRSQRIVPLKIAERGVSGLATQRGFGSPFAMKVKPKDLQVFTRQFSTMISSGIPIVQCIEILTAQTANASLKHVLGKVKTNIESGKRLADSMEGYPKVFSNLYVSLVRAGEESGALDVILTRLAQYIEKSVRIRNKIVSAMWYPAGIIIVAFIVIVGLLTFVIPKFEALFQNSNQNLPALTQWVIDASHFMQSNWYLVVGVFFGAIIGIRQYYESPDGRFFIDKILIELPVLGPLLQKGAIARFSRTMATMLSSGVNIIESLEICSKVVGNAVVDKALLRAKHAISEGKSITQPLSKEKHIPSMVTQMIGVGEATGRLDTMFGKIADFYEEEVDYAVTALTSVMEPLMMVILGGIIAIIVVAMYLPIFSLAGTMG